MSNKNGFFARCLPHPFVSAWIALVWLMLSHSATFYDISVAGLLGLCIPKLIQPFLIKTQVNSWSLALRLFFVVLWDIILCNIQVAKQILGPTHALQPKWYRVPLDSDHEYVNTLLAMIITTTPGTVSAGIDQERGDILVHALNSDDTEQDIRDIKQRYEQPLMAIFNVKPQENGA
ncbi:Na+/H+ antiporter subunit E [Acinetobacter larvae]|uniref:Pesticidal protein Cry1Ba n=1 Tax=Acinetobacter larvae TaxID=1789224 RepID=A0A1B2M2F1_9GAMM|nr:Na+/H+ antiporter subunit E [Acinetobacter larvae]AOA59368.1 pesticidal protein Cry1Ba [Acinetobacter larvae]